MKSKKWTMQITLLALALLMLSMAFFAFKLAYAQEPSVWTDKADYAPEETVTICGAGFVPYSTVTVSLTRPDGHIDQWSVAADEFGGFTTTYQLDGITGTYTVTATDGTNTAATAFTDGPKVTVQWSDGDCEDIKVTASQLTSGNNYYITYTDPDGNVQRKTPTFPGPNAYTEYFVLDIALPKVLGTWTVKLYEVGVTNPKDTATVKIDKMVWTTDSTYVTMKTSFAQGETVYIKAIGLESGKYYNFRLDPPTGSSICVFSSYQYVSGTELTGSYVLPADAPTGSWKLHVRKADNAAGTSHECHYVDRYFTVTQYTPPPTATVTFGQVGVSTDFAGVILTVDGTDYHVSDLPKSFTWNVGTDHTFEYYSPLTVNGKQYVWTSTSGLSTEQGGTIHVESGGGTVTGYYKTQYYLTVTSDHGVPSGAGWYDAGDTAYAGLDTGEITIDGTKYLFVQWSSNASGTNYAQSDPIIMDGPKFAVALWKTQYYLTVVSPYGTTGGEGWYDKYTYAYATVTPLVVPGPSGVQYVFTNWSGDASGSTSPSNSIYMDGPKTAIANWKTQYYLTVRTDPPGIATIPGEGWCDSSQSVQLSAPTVSGYTFQYWDIDGTSQGSGMTTITVVMNAPHTATAHYSVVPATATVTFSQIGVGSDFTDVVLTVDGVNYGIGDLPKSFEWTLGSVHTFEYHSPLLVSTGKRYVWASTSGLSTLQSGTITVSSGGGTVTGYYRTQYNVTIGQSGVGADFTGTVAVVDGVSLKVADLPKSYWWDSGSSHSFAFQSPLTVSAARQYRWISTSGLSAARSDSLVITGSGSIIGNYEVYVPPAQVDLTCQCYVTDGSFRKIGSFATVFTRVNYATYRLSSTKPNVFYYGIQVTNPGAAGVTDVVLSFQLDPEFVIVGSDPVQVHTGYGRTGSRVSVAVSYNLNSGTVNIASIGAGQTLYVTISMDYKFKGQTFTRSQALSWVLSHPSNKFSCTIQQPNMRTCSVTIKDPAEVEQEWMSYVQAITLMCLAIVGFGLAFKREGKGKIQQLSLKHVR